MKIIHINATYGLGSTGHIVKDLHDYLLQNGEESYVFCGIKASSEKKEENVKIIGNSIDHKIHALLRRFSHKHGGHSVIATKKLCRQISDINPDVVHLHNLHSNYINLKVLLEYLAKRKISVVITLHDCWFYTGYCMHYLRYGCDKWRNECENCDAINSSLCKKFITEKRNLFDKLKFAAIGVSKWIAEDVKYSVLKNAKIVQYIYNWVDFDVFQPRAVSRDKLKKLFGIDSDHKIILGVSQGWAEEKGLNDFIYLAEKTIGIADVVLVGRHSSIDHPENLHFLDYTKNREELSELYSVADVFVNPSRMETFGLVTVEAMACGTPVVGYANTGTKELIKEDCGKLVENGNREKLLSSVKEVLVKPKEKYTENCRNYVIGEFSKEIQLKKYSDIYKQISEYGHAES